MNKIVEIEMKLPSSKVDKLSQEMIKLEKEINKIKKY